MKLIEAKQAKEFASTFLADKILQAAVNAVVDNCPATKAYSAHEVAEILADVFGDTCACNFNGNDEWLPYKCELLDCCPNTYGVACWEQYLKFRDGERRTDG